jgi:hypothetical protein
MHEPPFAVALFRDIGDFMRAAADCVEQSTLAASDGQPRFSEPQLLVTEHGVVVLDLTPYWNRIVSTLRRQRPKDTKLVVALLRGFGDLVYAIADFLERNPKGLIDD